MQKVQTYYSMLDAKNDMNKHIRSGWRVHTCTMGCYLGGYLSAERVIVVYNKED